MANRTTYVVQAFVLKRGKLAPGQKEVAQTKAGAIKRAQAWAIRNPGAAAVCIVAREETGELASTTIVEQFGQVPDDFVESLMG